MNKLPRGIKKESKPLLRKSLNSLTLSIELFNRPSDLGRSDTVLILFDHAVEMLLKASILQRGVRIRDAGKPLTIGFQTCIDRACSNPACQFVSSDESTIFNATNALRDAVQHYFMDISEEQLYLHVQSGVTLIRDVMRRVFDIDLVTYLPRRVLPISTVALTTVEVLYDEKLDEVRKLLSPGKRRRQEALAALRPLIILERAIQGQEGQPSEQELARIADHLRNHEEWRSVFPGVNLVEFETDGTGPTMSLRISKKEGIPVVLVAPEADGAASIAVRRVNELGYYNLMTKQIAARLGLSIPKFLALAAHIGLQNDEEFFKVFEMGTQEHKRYSQKALERARAEMEDLSSEDWEVIWQTFGPGKGNARRQVA